MQYPNEKTNQRTPVMGTQTHVHEFLESVKLAEEGADRHFHQTTFTTLIQDPLT